MKDNPTLRVDLQHIKLFDPDLGAHLQKSPSECFPLVRGRSSYNTCCSTTCCLMSDLMCVMDTAA